MKLFFINKLLYAISYMYLCNLISLSNKQYLLRKLTLCTLGTYLSAMRKIIAYITAKMKKLKKKTNKYLNLQANKENTYF